MPNGFIGKYSEQYLSDVNNCYSRNNNTYSDSRGPMRLQYSADTAMSGQYNTYAGNSSNIVFDPDIYDEMLRRVQIIDEQAGEDLYRVAIQIEEMCETIYIIPETLPKFLSILNSVKDSLREFRSLTEEACIQTRKFVNAIDSID